MRPGSVGLTPDAPCPRRHYQNSSSSCRLSLPHRLPRLRQDDRRPPRRRPARLGVPRRRCRPRRALRPDHPRDLRRRGRGRVPRPGGRRPRRPVHRARTPSSPPAAGSSSARRTANSSSGTGFVAWLTADPPTLLGPHPGRPDHGRPAAGPRPAAGWPRSSSSWPSASRSTGRVPTSSCRSGRCRRNRPPTLSWPHAPPSARSRLG